MEVAIVDDDTIQIITIKKIIESIKDGVKKNISAYSIPFEAIEAFNNTNNLPDLLFLDVQMPMMDGWELLDILQQKHPQAIKKIKVYIVTSIPKGHDNQLAKYPMVQKIIPKPISFSEIEKLFI